MEDQEIEVKFYIDDLAKVEQRLQSLGATLVQPRVLETNLRFDTSELGLANSFRVIRLRQDTLARMTYKGPASEQQGTRVRQEIEFVVSDFRAARAFLEALGYQVTMMYEKYRTTYDFVGAHIALDELPFGKFVEIEGSDPTSIQGISRRLGLSWEASVPLSYVMLFESLQASQGLAFRDLIFDNFTGLHITAEALGVSPADKLL